MSCAVFAQTTRPSFICSYDSEPVSLPLTAVNSSDDALRAIRAITDVVGLEPDFEVKEANIPNAAAVVFNNKRYILYNPEFIRQINNASGDKWASIAILAHEIGHHLDGHTLSGTGSHPESELQADEFSGFVLRKMGATLDEAQSAMKIAGNELATDTHPGKPDRLISIENGWTKSDDQVSGKKFIAKALPSSVKREEEQAAKPAYRVSYSINPAYVNFTVHFDAAPENKYYISKENELIMLRGEKVMQMGAVIKTSREDFPLAIRLTDNECILISRDGTMVNVNGRTIGRIEA